MQHILAFFNLKFFGYFLMFNINNTATPNKVNKVGKSALSSLPIEEVLSLGSASENLIQFTQGIYSAALF